MSCMRDGFVQGQLLDGRFEALAPLNHGSFGMVFLARDDLTGDQVAIKCSSKNPADDSAANADYLVELACHTRLGQHPNIVNLLHAFETEHHTYLVLEFCSMGDLYEAIRLGRGPLETERVRSFMLQLVDAVQCMHSKGLYHRDIKPENIFLCQDGSMKLGDFGLSTTETWTFESSVGSDRYMAPEQYDPADLGYCPAKADVWAVGICLLNILFSRNPFVTPSESDVIYADFVRDRQSLFDVFPSMSQDTFEVLAHALCIDPEKRSLFAVRDALERLVSFTTDDELFDDFCTEDRDVVSASANRQPLRTPSIQNPPDDNCGAFPWAKALRMSPVHPSRQLSVIHDIEHDDEIFPSDIGHGQDQFYGSMGGFSISSVIDSALGASVKSMNLHEPKPRNPPKATPAPTNSLPVDAGKPAGSLTLIFGKKARQEVASKSWSDMWEEEEEEEEEEMEDARRRFNSQNFSSDTLDEDVTIRATAPMDIKTVSIKANDPSVCPGLASYDYSSCEDLSSLESIVPKTTYQLPVHSPTTKKKKRAMDWSALGNFRRAYNSDSDETEKPKVQKSDVTTKKPASITTSRKHSTNTSWRKGFGMAMKSSSGNRIPAVGLRDGVMGDGKDGGRHGSVGETTKVQHGVTYAKSPPSRLGSVFSPSPLSTLSDGLFLDGVQGLQHSRAGNHGFGSRSGKLRGHRGSGGECELRVREWRRVQQDEALKFNLPSEAPAVAEAKAGRKRRSVDTDVEWVGGWHDLHL